MDGDELALQVGGKLGYLQAVLGQDALDLIAVGLAFRGFVEIEEPGVPGRDLHAGIAKLGGPFGHAGQGVEGRLIARELGQEDAWPLDVGCHAANTSSPAPRGTAAGRSQVVVRSTQRFSVPAVPIASSTSNT